MIWRFSKRVQVKSCSVLCQAKRHIILPSKSKINDQSAKRRQGRQVTLITEPVNSIQKKRQDVSTIQSLYESSDFNKLKSLSDLPIGHEKRTILDKIFRDTGPNNIVTRKTQISGLKNRPYVFQQPSHPQVPVASLSEEIHGVPSFMVQHAYTFRFIYSTPIAYECKYFTAYYLPPWHFLALGRKSRPALISTYSDGKEYNGNPEFANLPNSISTSNNDGLQQRSKNPMSYAFARKEITKKTRNALFKAFHENPNSVDGVYLIRSHSYPNDLVDLQIHVDELVQKSANMAKNSDMSWVDTLNKKIKWTSFEYMCKRRLMPPLVKLNRGSCLNWRKL